MNPDAARGWVVVIPIKGTTEAKSRLALEPDPVSPVEGRAQLAIAFAADTVAAVFAAKAVAEVIVVTNKGSAPVFERFGAHVVADPASGLNAAIRAGIAVARARRPDSPVAAMTGDLPTVRAADIDSMLELAHAHLLALVADKEGTGTTTILAAAGVELVPRFGVGSAERHRAAGHVELDIPAGSRMRLDVDTADDLVLARAVGLGPRSAALLDPDPSPDTAG